VKGIANVEKVLVETGFSICYVKGQGNRENYLQGHKKSRFR